MSDTVLIEHGTTLYRLKPVNILQAADADLKLRERKDRRERNLDDPYSFARQHVRRARGALHLIALAYFEGQPKTNKRSTMLVYRDRALLRETLIDLLKGEN